MSKKNKLIHVKLIANPGAGKGADAANNLKLIINQLKENGLKADVAYAKPKEEATPIARRAVKNGYKIIIAMGGDGTIEAVMRGMVGSKARLGIIMAGTENNIAQSLGIPEDLQEACALIASDNTLKIDLGQVKTRKGKKFVFFEMATIGLSATIYPDVIKANKGNLTGLKDAVMTLVHQEIKPTVSLTFNDESKVEVETMLVMVSNTPLMGQNFMMAPRASLMDGLLDISVFPEFSKPELLRYFAAVMDGGYSGNGKVQKYQARKLKIKASPKLDVLADGFALGEGKVTIKALAGALRVIATQQIPGSESVQKGDIEILPVPVSTTEGENHREVSVISLG